jgi:TIGR03009 family protein
MQVHRTLLLGMTALIWSTSPLVGQAQTGAATGGRPPAARTNPPPNSGAKTLAAGQSRPAGSAPTNPSQPAAGSKNAVLQQAGSQAQPRPSGVRPTAGTSGQPAVGPRGTPAPAAAAGEKPERPEGKPLVVEPLPPELERLLIAWERGSAKIERLEGSHQRTVANLVFATEKRAAGKFYFEAPSRGRIDMEGVKPGPKDKALYQTKEGEPFELQADLSQSWICTGNEVLVIDVPNRQYEVFPLPEDIKGERIIESPLPFLFGMKAEDAKRRYKLSLAQFKPEAFDATVEVVPLLQMDRQNYSKAMIRLDLRLFVPTVVRQWDPSGNMITTYVFKDPIVNGGNAVDRLKAAFGGDPFRPNLRGYQLVQQPPVNEGEIQPINGQMPDKGRARAPAPAQPPTAQPRTAQPGAVPQRTGQTGAASGVPGRAAPPPKR